MKTPQKAKTKESWQQFLYLPALSHVLTTIIIDDLLEKGDQIFTMVRVEIQQG